MAETGIEVSFHEILRSKRHELFRRADRGFGIAEFVKLSGLRHWWFNRYEIEVQYDTHDSLAAVLSMHSLYRSSYDIRQHN